MNTTKSPQNNDALRQKTNFKENSKVGELLKHSPFIFKGTHDISPLGSFDFISGRVRTPCIISVSSNTKN